MSSDFEGKYEEEMDSGEFYCIGLEPGKLVFHERKGRIVYSFVERYRGREFHFFGKIPEEVVLQPKRVIRQYAVKTIENMAVEMRQSTDKLIAYFENPNIPITAQYEGKTLRGCVVHADGRLLRVKLESPLQGEADISYGFASAMAGRYMFGKERDENDMPMLSKNGKATARDLLIRVYREARYTQRNKKTINLVEHLNDENDG